MDPFELPETLPDGPTALQELRGEAVAWFEHLREFVSAGEDLSDEQLAQLRQVVADLATIDGGIEAIETANAERRAEAESLIERGQNPSVPEEDGDDAESDDAATDSEDDADTDEDSEVEVVEGEVVEAIPALAASSGAKRRTKFSGLGRGSKPDLPARTKDVGWRMDPNTFGYKPGLVGFKEIAEAVDSIRPGSRARSNRHAPHGNTDYAAHTIARLDRELPEIRDPHALVNEILRATNESNLPGGSLVAAGGWCAPSETLYDFCAVPQATDLLSVPEITITRGGVRWPVEPDLSVLFDDFEWFFTEPELEAVDTNGDPTAVKTCVDIPCPDEFAEIRLNAMGYCVEVGILQEQGWPELIQWFLESITQEHFRALSRRSILDIVNGSEPPIVIPPASQIAAGSSILNSLALVATNLRLDKGLGRTATIEGIAPSWLHEVIRADLSNQQGVDTKNVTDAQITSWLSARGIALQFVGDWQTRGTGEPGNLATVQWPNTVDVVLYPAGTWFRALSKVIEFGAMYPRELLSVNRYTRFFTEDAIAIGKRCNRSIVVTVPICPNGAFGEQLPVDCGAAAP